MNTSKLLRIVVALCAWRAAAATYTITATNLTLHTGDLVPPLIFNVSEYPGSYSGVFQGQPKLSTSATSKSPAGTYRISINAGSMRTVHPEDTLTFVAGTATVLPEDGTGAHLSAGNAVPAGYFSAPYSPAMNVKSNPVAHMAGDCITDDTAALQALVGFGRTSYVAKVNVIGKAVTAVAGISFTGLSGAVQINGMVATIASVTDAKNLVLASPIGDLTNAILKPGRSVVSTSGTTVTLLSGPLFDPVTPGTQVRIQGLLYKVAALVDSRHLTLVTSPPTSSRTDAFIGNEGAPSSHNPLALYFPAGCYLVSAPIFVFGNYWTFIGDGPQTSYLRLAPNSRAFNGSNPETFLRSASVSRNANFGEFIYNMGINIGPGNPQAYIVTWLGNNWGAMRNVQIWADDSRCLHGVDMDAEYPGPSLLKNVAIYGCQYGLHSTQTEYNVVAENITTEGQTVAGIYSQNFHLSLRHWLHYSGTGAFIGAGPNSTAAVIDSTLVYGGRAATTAIVNSGGAFFGRNISCKGYQPCEIDSASGTVTRTLLPPEFWTGKTQTVFDGDQGESAASLRLLEAETPAPLDGCTTAGCSWQDLGTSPASWPAKIANSNSRSLYVAPGAYPGAALSATVPDAVNYINFNNIQSAPGGPNLQITLTVSGRSSTPLILDGCIPEHCLVNHTGPRALVLRDANVAYQAQPGAGDLYLDDVVFYSYSGTYGPTFFPGQNIWGRQVNIETGGHAAHQYWKFTCDGATAWILGYKTESESTSVVEKNKCRAEVFGFFLYNLSAPPPGSSPIELSNSSLFATGFSFFNKAGFGHPNWVNESRGGKTAALPTADVTKSQVLNMFVSRGHTAAPENTPKR